jgi:ABC-type glutathione transport system ATPase component
VHLGLFALFFTLVLALEKLNQRSIVRGNGGTKSEGTSKSCVKVSGLGKLYEGGRGTGCRSCCRGKWETEQNQVRGLSFEVKENEILAVIG